MSKPVLVTPILHPAAVERGMWKYEWAQVTYLERVAAGLAQPVDVSLPPPNTVLYPNLDDLDRWLVKAWSLRGVAIDLETAGPHLICAGMTAFPFDLEGWGPENCYTVCLRFRLKGGGLYWLREEDHRKAIVTLSAVLASSHLVKVFHNGVGFDVPYLEDLGFVVAGRWLDTMVMAHSCYSEMPKGLQFLATLHLGLPVWKTLKDPKDGDADLDADLGDGE